MYIENKDFGPVYAKEARQRSQAKTQSATAIIQSLHRIGMKMFARRGLPEWAREIVSDVAAKHLVSVYDLAGEGRSVKIVAARHEAIYRLKEHKQTLTSTQIGKWFARDHTSILFAIASHAEKTGEPKLVGYDLNMTRRRNAANQAYARKRRGN